MPYKMFVTLLKYKTTRKIILSLKKSQLMHKLVPTMNEWYEKDHIHQCGSINLIGNRCLENFKEISSLVPFNKPLIITGKTVAKLKTTSLVFDQLKKSKKNYVVFNGSKPNPSIETVNSIIKAYNDNNCDALITIGGGSPHDAAKAAGLLLSNSKRINKLQGINVSKNAFKMPLICINTTAGSGSEASNIAVITDEHRQHKMTIVDKHCQPRATINDSQMMLDLPPETTAWTGIDALTHAVEAYLSIINNSMVKIYARRAMDIISEYLPIAYKTPSNSVAREKMAYAEFLAGISFNSASLGFVHSMSHALSGMFNTPHGLANAILLPYVLDYELKNKKIGLMLGEISDHMNFANLDADWYHKAQTCVKHIIEFTRSLGTPKTLNEIQKDITPLQVKKLSLKAMKDFCGISNPIQLSKKQVMHIYRNAITGTFDNLSK